MRWGYIHMGSLTGGAGGFAVPTPSVFGWELNSAARKFYVLLVIVVLIVVSTNRLLRSRFGRAIMGTKENEAAATMLGVPTSITFLATDRKTTRLNSSHYCHN